MRPEDELLLFRTRLIDMRVAFEQKFAGNGKLARRCLSIGLSYSELVTLIDLLEGEESMERLSKNDMITCVWVANMLLARLKLNDLRRQRA